VQNVRPGLFFPTSPSSCLDHTVLPFFLVRAAFRDTPTAPGCFPPGVRPAHTKAQPVFPPESGDSPSFRHLFPWPSAFSALSSLAKSLPFPSNHVSPYSPSPSRLSSSPPPRSNNPEITSHRTAYVVYPRASWRPVERDDWSAYCQWCPRPLSGGTGFRPLDHPLLSLFFLAPPPLP